MRTAKTKMCGIFSGVLCGLTLVAFGGMLYLINKEYAAYDNELHARATSVATEKEASSLNALMTETADNREALAHYVLTEDSIIDFLALIGTLAHTNGMVASTRSLAVEPIPGNTVFEYLTLGVDVTGSFESITYLLALLESLPYQVHLRAVTVEQTRDESKKDSLWHGLYHLYVTKYK